jgi:hypothetical protein
MNVRDRLQGTTNCFSENRPRPFSRLKASCQNDQPEIYIQKAEPALFKKGEVTVNEKNSIYANSSEVMNAFTPFYQEEAGAKIREADALDGWFALLSSAAVDPAPLTIEDFEALTPYAAPQRVRQLIDSALEGGFVSGDEGSGFRLTDKGRSVLSAFFDTAHELISSAPVLPQDDMQRLVGLLQRLVEASESLPYPEEKPNLARSRWTEPGESAPDTVRVDQYLTDLQLFRDDAHITAWQANDVDGRSWETLTFLWRDDVHTAAELLEKLPRRGYTEEDYAASLAYLAGKGWISPAGHDWQLTANGRQIRQEAEEETDRIYFAGWNTLDETELNDLDDLLQRLLDQLKEAAPAAEAV